ncbi:short-chain fatty acyl-CoA regulator family protein [Novosphingobium sp. TCA1]|uniref:helix-turn-helix domain-containing protein n=1 Tax=Novosphingobium sp. TCA1 TaxID=2682474 RepID=UPI00130C1A0C|nr:helix-turn-helix transcriptional regulator [Novosphingobium sp. TCA1]GFE75396.1 Cro/Cl family transcriptional regulator [Novosphingobium sp. TCA1]
MGIRRTFAGANLKSLRSSRNLRQSELAATLGISASYLSQLENDDRPLTLSLADRLRKAFPVEWQDIPIDRSAELLHTLEEAISDTAQPRKTVTANLSKLVEQFPEFAERFVELHRSHRADQQRLEMLDEALGADNTAGGRLPWEEVRDWFHNVNNYVDELDRHAEAFCATLSQKSETPSIDQMREWLERRNITLQFERRGPVRRYDSATRTLIINSAQANDSVKFHISWHITTELFRKEINQIVENAELKSETARQLLAIGLGNYMAGALIMPYERFRRAAGEFRHDVDELRHLFGTTFEQVCHRLSTLQRPNARGTPMYFCRVDMAGNITKRHSATRLRFARFGGACPLWIVHEAVAVPDRIHVQLAEMPDGVRYVSIAKGLVKQTGSYARRERRFAVALGCEAAFASEFVYADELNLNCKQSVSPIGESCRICPRGDCDQRAFPPNDREITVDLSRREIVPYQISSR